MPADLDALESAHRVLVGYDFPNVAANVLDAVAEIRELRYELARARQSLATYARDYVTFTAPRWTKEKPTVPGWYWMRRRIDYATRESVADGVVRIHPAVDGMMFHATDSGWLPLPEDAEAFSGPLPEPAEPET